MKTIKLRRETVNQLKRRGTSGDTINSILSKLIDYYTENKGVLEDTERVKGE